MRKKVLISLSIIGIVAAIAVGATIAYFSDTEISTGNKFIAGNFNLKVDNTCHYNGRECICVTNPENDYYGNCYWDIGGDGHFEDGEVSEDNRCYCTWQEKDLEEGDLFFNFDDIKPGDEGEDTISLHIINNDAWLCAKIENLKSDDNGCNEPESDIDSTCGEGEGELDQNLFFTVWKDDDCDNNLDDGEEILVQHEPASEGLWPLADSTTGEPIPGDTVVCYGVKWEVPLSTSNIIQSDSLKGDISFIAIQARNMDNFKCSDLVNGGREPQCEINSDCDDNNSCTVDICENGECVYEPKPNGSPCDDNDPCTINDVCQNGECMGTPKNCDDGNPCTSDTCNAETGECEHLCDNTGTLCDDGNSNTTNDHCQGCECIGEPVECSSDSDCYDNNVCTIDTCNDGVCQHSCNTGASCDDGNPFTFDDKCLIGDDGCECVGSIYNPEVCTSDSDCNDNNPCTNDICNNGSCLYLPKCDDGNECTQDSCDPQTGECSYEPLSGYTCDDGNACTLLDICENGVCRGHSPKLCWDADPCTDDFCNPSTGECYFVSKNCDDGNPCTIDSCSFLTGECVHQCNEGASCTLSGIPGSCVLNGNSCQCEITIW